MTFQINVVLRDTNHAVAEMVNFKEDEPLTLTDRDVERVLRRILLAIRRAKHPGSDEESAIALRGLSWVVDSFDEGVVIAVEGPSGSAVAGPFDIQRQDLDQMVERVISSGVSESIQQIH